MKILFLQHQSENLGIQFLSSYLKSLGHQTALAFDPSIFNDHYLQFPALYRRFGFHRRIDAAVENFQPDLIGVSCTTDSYRWALEQSARIKDRFKLPIVFGGVHPTLVPEVVIAEEPVDYVIVGEAEEALAELMANLNDPALLRQVKNLWSKHDGAVCKNELRPLVRDLDRFPAPDKEIFYSQNPLISRNYRTLSSRGCPFACAYCFESAFKQIYSGEKCSPRHRSPEHLMRELEEAKKRYKIKLVVICDEDFLNRRDMVEEFLPQYRERVGLPFRCQTAPLNLKPERARALRRAGCVDVIFGVETLNERNRKELLNRPGTNEMMAEAIRAVRKEGMKIQVDQIMGLPGDTVEDQRTAALFYDDVRPSLINVFWFRYFPMTDITRLAKEKGWLTEKEFDEINRGIGQTYVWGGHAKDQDRLRRITMLFDALPLLPKGTVRWIIRKGYDRHIPGGRIMQIILRSIIALIQGDYVFAQYVRNYLFWIRQSLLS